MLAEDGYLRNRPMIRARRPVPTIGAFQILHRVSFESYGALKADHTNVRKGSCGETRL
jgi:hypothetical protein